MCIHQMVEYVGLTDRFMNCKLCGAKESDLNLNSTEVVSYTNHLPKLRYTYRVYYEALDRCSEIKLEEPPKLDLVEFKVLRYYTHPLELPPLTVETLRNVDVETHYDKIARADDEENSDE